MVSCRKRVYVFLRNYSAYAPFIRFRISLTFTFAEWLSLPWENFTLGGKQQARTCLLDSFSNKANLERNGTALTASEDGDKREENPLQNATFWHLKSESWDARRILHPAFEIEKSYTENPAFEVSFRMVNLGRILK